MRRRLLAVTLSAAVPLGDFSAKSTGLPVHPAVDGPVPTAAVMLNPPSATNNLLSVAVLQDISRLEMSDLVPGAKQGRRPAWGACSARGPETEDGRPRATARKVIL
jgi:hypothetical protein